MVYANLICWIIANVECDIGVVEGDIVKYDPVGGLCHIRLNVEKENKGKVVVRISYLFWAFVNLAPSVPLSGTFEGAETGYY